MHTFTHTRVITWLVYTWHVSFSGICVCECASVSICVCARKCAYMRLICTWHASLVPSACAHMRVCVWKCVHTWDLHGASTRAMPLIRYLLRVRVCAYACACESACILETYMARCVLTIRDTWHALSSGICVCECASVCVCVFVWKCLHTWDVHGAPLTDLCFHPLHP